MCVRACVRACMRQSVRVRVCGLNSSSSFILFDNLRVDNCRPRNLDLPGPSTLCRLLGRYCKKLYCLCFSFMCSNNDNRLHV